MDVILPIVSVLVGAGGLGALLQARSLNRRTNAQAHQAEADADVTIGSGWQVLWETQRRDNNELRERLVKVEAREEECRARLAELEHAARESIAAVEHRVMALLDEEIAKRKATSG